jgi:hypothetical protein
MILSESTRAGRARVDDNGVSAAEAVRAIPNGARIFVHGAAPTPTPLLETLGATTLPLSRVHAFVRTNRPLHEHHGSAKL